LAFDDSVVFCWKIKPLPSHHIMTPTILLDFMVEDGF